MAHHSWALGDCAHDFIPCRKGSKEKVCIICGRFKHVDGTITVDPGYKRPSVLKQIKAGGK